MIRKSHGVALAALALAASGAFAQSSVKVYGLLDAGFGSIKPAYDPANKPATPTVNSGLMTTSFIGFSGVEDLGGGLKAEFALESFLGLDDGSNVTNNAGNFWGRASWVGLSGSFGRVAIGQYDNPLFTFGYTYNPFGSSMTFSPTMRQYAYLGQTGTTLNTRKSGVGFDTGWVNSLTYETPNLSGFTGVVQYAFKESTTSGDGNSWALGGFYNAGPLSIGAVYVNADTGAPAGAWTDDERVFALGASFDFGMAKAFFQYTSTKEDVAGSADPKDTIWQLGVSVPVSSAGTVMASYGQLKNKVDGSESITDKVLSLAYDHALSKRTDVYVAYMNNKQTDLKTGNSFAVGIRHNF